MRIQIIKILSNPAKRSLVEFQSAYGVGKAYWAEGVPRLFQDCAVEFEIPERLVWGQTIVPSAKETIAVSYQENALHLFGQLSSVDKDGGGYMRIGEAIVLIEIEETKDYNFAPCFVQIISQQATLYDTNL